MLYFNTLNVDVKLKVCVICVVYLSMAPRWSRIFKLSSSLHFPIYLRFRYAQNKYTGNGNQWQWISYFKSASLNTENSTGSKTQVENRRNTCYSQLCPLSSPWCCYFLLSLSALRLCWDVVVLTPGRQVLDLPSFNKINCIETWTHNLWITQRSH